MSSVGLIIIGNEILNGQVKDENSYHLAKSLPILGLKLSKISVIADDVVEISEEVSLFSRLYDHVITSGGIGPTHDDVTFEAVAKAFNQPLHQHPELTQKLVEFFGLSSSNNGHKDPKLRLARLPLLAKLTYGVDVATGNQIPYPVISCSNVIILPGIPSLFRKGFHIIKESLMDESKILYKDAIYFSKEETKITDDLNAIVKEFDKSVLFGSYPVLNNNFYKVKITMESDNVEQIFAASNRLKTVIGVANIAKYDPMVFEHSSEEVYRLSEEDSDLGRRVRSSLSTIDEAFRQYRPDEVAVAFTGGKDCTVLLHLVHAYLQGRRPPLPMVAALLVRTRPSFPEVEEFVGRAIRAYGVVPPASNFLEYNGPMKESLWQMSKEHAGLRVVFMGTRGTDPDGGGIGGEAFSRTTEGWPPLALVRPLLAWRYADVWALLLRLRVPYCGLYDRGFTSIGGADNTLPNERLLFVDEDGQMRYRPAHMLQEEDTERSGRRAMT